MEYTSQPIIGTNALLAVFNPAPLCNRELLNRQRISITIKLQLHSNTAKGTTDDFAFDHQLVFPFLLVRLALFAQANRDACRCPSANLHASHLTSPLDYSADSTELNTRQREHEPAVQLPSSFHAVTASR